MAARPSHGQQSARERGVTLEAPVFVAMATLLSGCLTAASQPAACPADREKACYAFWQADDLRKNA